MILSRLVDVTCPIMRTVRTLNFEGFLWVALGAALCIGSLKLGLGTINQPGVGFVPFLAGSLLALVGFILGVSKAFEKTTRKEDPENIVDISIKDFGKRRVYTLVILVLYTLSLESLGFLIATFLLLFFLFKIMEPRRWLAPIFISVFSVIISYLVFNVWLKINFPQGIFFKI